MLIFRLIEHSMDLTFMTNRYMVHTVRVRQSYKLRIKNEINKFITHWSKFDGIFNFSLQVERRANDDVNFKFNFVVDVMVVVVVVAVKIVIVM